jgi:hypothetical protein
MPSPLIEELQIELRHIASTASGPLMNFLDYCASVPEADRARMEQLSVTVGHEAKAIARIGQIFAWLEEQNESDEAIISGILARYQLHKNRFEEIAQDHHLAAEMVPFLQMVHESIAACERMLVQLHDSVK